MPRHRFAGWRADLDSVDRMVDFYAERGCDRADHSGINGRSRKTDRSESIAIIKRVTGADKLPSLSGSAPVLRNGRGWQMSD